MNRCNNVCMYVCMHICVPAAHKDFACVMCLVCGSDSHPLYTLYEHRVHLSALLCVLHVFFHALMN